MSHCVLVRKISNLFEPYLFQIRSPKNDIIHLNETMGWLTRAQDACGGKGVSICYDSVAGWHADPYPETSGYILATFLKYSDFNRSQDFLNRAISIGLWEIEIQRKDGAVFSSVRNNIARVFNTGQVILGLCCLFERTQDQLYLDAAVRSGDYLVSVQESDGSWVKDTYCGARTYHTRVAWALLRLAELTSEQKFLEAGIKNLRWALTKQNTMGWFNDCGFYSEWPTTHVISYTLRGLIESQQLVNDKNWGTEAHKTLEAILKTGEALLKCSSKYNISGIPGLLPAAFDARWEPRAGYSCLAGNAQLAICFMRLGHLTDDPQYFKTASNLISTLKRTQALNCDSFGVRGGLAGSFPFHARYVSGAFPNWSAKFMADALMMSIKHEDKWWVKA